MNAVLSIDDIPQTELVGRRVLVRIEAKDDVPGPDPLSTVAFLSKFGARVVIATDKQLDDQRSLLTHLSGREVCKLGEWKGETGQRAVAHLPEGSIGLIENLALDPGEQTADDSFAKQLAQLCDIYCNDAIEAEPPIPDLSLEEKAIAAMDALVSPEMKDGQGPPTTTEVTTGSASDEILHLARERKVDLITIGTYALVLQ